MQEQQVFHELPDFETLRRMAEHDPAQLECLRTSLTRQLIERAPARTRPRLRGLQFEVDARVRLAPTPLAACITVSAMMHEALDELRGALNGELRRRQQAQLAPVLAFPAEESMTHH